MSDYIYGVNLGGWLVLEKWMTPTLFADVADEYSLSNYPDGEKRIKKHRQTFITEEDFAWLRRRGIGLVRIPVGYWLFEPLDGFVPSVKHLDHAMEWAEKYGLRVLVDLHGARGSQNGKAHSGRAGESEWFTNKKYRDETIIVLERIAERYKDSSALWGVELLNEPRFKVRHYFTLLRFYRQAYRRLTKILRPGTYVVFHDAFQPLLYAGTFWKSKKHPVMMDVHWYGFSSKAKGAQEFFRRSSRARNALLGILQLWQPVIVGEWSAVMPRRFLEEKSKTERTDLLQRNAASQRTAYEKAAGWIYWNYKTESGGMWNFRDLVERGVMASPKSED